VADVLRGPVSFGPYTKPLVIAVGLANLLTGTLAPAAAAPFVTVNFSQVQRRPVNADTSAGSNPLRFPSSLAPFTNETLRLIQRRSIGSELSRSAYPLSYLSAERPFQRQPDSVNYRQPVPLHWIPPDLLTSTLGLAVTPPFFPVDVQRPQHRRPVTYDIPPNLQGLYALPAVAIPAGRAMFLAPVEFRQFYEPARSDFASPWAIPANFVVTIKAGSWIRYRTI
jgi:hypothetical protein